MHLAPSTRGGCLLKPSIGVCFMAPRNWPSIWHPKGPVRSSLGVPNPKDPTRDLCAWCRTIAAHWFWCLIRSGVTCHAPRGDIIWDLRCIFYLYRHRWSCNKNNGGSKCVKIFIFIYTHDCPILSIPTSSKFVPLITNWDLDLRCWKNIFKWKWFVWLFWETNLWRDSSPRYLR